jgi:hypothetical protein
VTFTSEINENKKIPVNPEIIRIRKDISWEDVSHGNEKKQGIFLFFLFYIYFEISKTNNRAKILTKGALHMSILLRYGYLWSVLQKDFTWIL